MRLPGPVTKDGNRRTAAMRIAGLEKVASGRVYLEQVELVFRDILGDCR